MVNKKARTINLKSGSKREFFLVHGYTGSTTDFNGLPEYLHKSLNADVKIILLRGHGTKIEDLDNVEYKDILNQVERELKKDLKKGKKIVVVDDGSTDNTEEIVKNFKNVKFLKNQKNMGKSYSMQRGVEASKSNILFFCDADLVGLNEKIIEQIVKPVIDNRVDMFIGLRNNKLQKTLHLFAINSGERALRREIWEKLPESFKRGYRIEAGLNHFVKRYGRGYDYSRFDYYQTEKEKKYGVIKGTALRWKMNFEVGVAYAIASINRINRFNKYGLHLYNK